MSNLQSSYTKTVALLHELEPNDCFLNQIRAPNLSDKEWNTLSLAAQMLVLSHSAICSNVLHSSLEGKIDCSVYNRLKRKLGFKVEQLRQQTVEHLDGNELYHIIDSMPLEACKFSRAKRARACRDNQTLAPD